MNAFGTSADITSLPSYASITHVFIMPSRDAVGLAVSSFDNQSLVPLPLYTHLPFTSPLLFSVSSIIASCAFFLSSDVMSLTSMGRQQCLLTSWSSSFLAAFSPLSWNTLSPL